MSDTHEQSFPVIADFGYSKHLSEGQQLVKRCGTYGYTAPEILSNTPYSFPIDIWSLGVLIFQLKTGEMPFHGIDTAKTKSISQQYQLGPILKGKFSSQISSSLKNLLTGMLETDPEKRLTIQGTLAHKWFYE